jgi:signal transduction histidine kinase
VLRTANARDWRSGNTGIRVSIADTGSGMSAETMARIFEPFYSTKGSLGTGLGLWVTKEIVGKHGGVIAVRSRVGAGTVFSIFFPLVSATQAAKADFAKV